MKNLVFSVSLLLLSSNLFSQDKFSSSETPEEVFEAKKSIIELNDKFDVVPTGINSPLSDIGATFFMNKYIMYSSRKTGAIGAGKDSNTNTPYNSLYCINLDKNGNLSHPYFFASVLNEQGNEAGLTFSPDQKTVYYTNSKPENSKNYQLYKASFDETCRCSNAWIKKELVNFSSNDFSIENPCISVDGKKMYFSSNMPGGYGGHDLYVADLDENGTPFNPKNLGQSINTVADEKFPYASQENELFFSSNGHSGYGGQDVYVARIKKNTFSQPINLGKTINTPADEIAFILATKKMGFVTTNRTNSKGLFDIYKFELEKQANELKGIAYEKNSKIALPNTMVSLIDSDGNEFARQMTNDKGNFTFDVIPLESYTIVAKKDGFNDFILPIKSSIGNILTNIELEQKKAEVTNTNIIVENIYFDYNKTTIKKESTLALDKIYDVLIVNPEMKITINAHTDSRGSEQYNLLLSEKRSYSALQYLVKKGIAKDRVMSKGYGETQLLSKCYENCTEADYDKDRRIEFLITK